MTKSGKANRSDNRKSRLPTVNTSPQEQLPEEVPQPEASIRWPGWICLLSGWLIPQLILIGPALVGMQVLIPFDLLHLPNVYSPDLPGEPTIVPHDGVLLDLILVDVPARNFCLREYRAGRLPLWQPQNFLGAPFACWPKYSPFEIPYWIWPSLVTLAWTRLLQMLCIGVGGWIFLRLAVGLSFWPAAVGSWCFPLIGFVTLWQGFPLIGSVVWLPWLLTAVHFTVRRPERWSTAGLTVATALVLLSGQPDVGGLSLLLSGFYAISRMTCEYGKSWPSWMRGGLALSLAWGLGILLAAPYWMPLIEYARTGVRLHERMAGVEERPPSGWTALVQAISPEYLGNTCRGSIYFGLSGNLLESAAGAFAGLIAALWLAPFAHCDPTRRGQSWFWSAMVVFGLAWQVGLPVLVDLMRLPPLNSLSYNRAVVMTAVAIVVLSSIGLEQILHAKLRFRTWQLIPLGLIIVAGLLFAVSTIDLPRIVQTDLPDAIRDGRETRLTLKDVEVIQGSFRSCYVTSSVLCLIAAAGWLWTFRGGPYRGVVVSCTVALLLGELILFGLRESRLRDFQPDYPRIPALEKLSTMPAGRAWSINCLPPNLNRTHNISDVRGYDAVDPKSVVDLLSLTCDPRIKSPKHAVTRDMVPIAFENRKKMTLHPIVNLLNVRYFISRAPLNWPLPVVVQETDYWVTENEAALPRAFIPESVERVREVDVIPRMNQFAFDPRKRAFVTENLELPLQCSGEVSLRDISPSELQLDVELKTDCLVVVSDMWDPDWKATIDGEPVDIVRTNSAVRGIRATAGAHQIRMRYQPAAVRRAILASSCALVIFTLWLVRIALRKSTQ